MNVDEVHRIQRFVSVQLEADHQCRGWALVSVVGVKNTRGGGGDVPLKHATSMLHVGDSLRTQWFTSSFSYLF